MFQRILLILIVVLAAACSSLTRTDEILIYDQNSFRNKSLNEKMVRVEGGTFSMGEKSLFLDERPIHSVKLSDFYLSRTEITQKDYMAVMGHNPSYFQGRNLPVENITWYDAINFANKLSLLEGFEPVYSFNGGQVTWDKSKNGYRLPTEAEWEYAARGGLHSKGFKYSGSDNIDDVAHHSGNSGKTTNKPVATKKPNELGLHDMTGNVYEWVWDWRTPYTDKDQINPSGGNTGDNKRVRGGSAFCSPYFSRIGWRNSYGPFDRKYFVGIRLARNTQ